jgi:hypothetical protein
MAKRIVRHSRRAERDAVRSLEDALDPIEDAHQAAKAEHQEAIASGDRDRIRAAKAAKVEAANRLEDARTWLRREAEIRKLQMIVIPGLERKLAGPILVKHGDKDAREDVQERARLQDALDAARAELAALDVEAVAYRRALQELGGVVVGDPVPPDLPPGSADVTMAPITTKATVNRRKEA